MTDEPSLDRDERPAEADRLVGRLNRLRSLPGPDPTHLPAALAPPAPTVVEEGPSAIPAAEIHTAPSRVYVTVDLPGIPKDAIEVQAWEDCLTVHAPRPGGPTYHLELGLPVRVDPRSATSTCCNGVLDITFHRDPRGSASRGESDE